MHIFSEFYSLFHYNQMNFLIWRRSLYSLSQPQKRKKCECNAAVHQLFIDFKKAYDSVKREVLYNILLEFGVHKKLLRLINL
jgi:hypothetical protein